MPKSLEYSLPRSNINPVLRILGTGFMQVNLFRLHGLDFRPLRVDFLTSCSRVGSSLHIVRFLGFQPLDLLGFCGLLDCHVLGTLHALFRRVADLIAAELLLISLALLFPFDHERFFAFHYLERL